MRSGSLKHRIAIETLTAGQDEFGGESTTWEPFAENVPASYEPLTGKEFFAADRINAKIIASFRIRHIAGITAAMRVNMSGRLFQIEGPPIDPRGAGRELRIMVSELL